MINHIRNFKHYYKYLLNSKFHLNFRDYVGLLLISTITLAFSFIVIVSSIPFLDLILGNKPEDFQKPTIYFLEFLEIIDVSNIFLAFSGIFVSSIILKAVCDIFYNYYAVSLQYKFMQRETLDLNDEIFKMDQKFYTDHPSSRIFNLYTRELERASEVITSLMLIFNSFLQIIIFITLPLFFNTKLTLIFILLTVILLSPMLIVNYLSIKQGFVSTKVSDYLFKSLNNNFLYSKFIVVHGLIAKANSLFLHSFRNYIVNKKILTILNTISGNFIQPVGILSIIITIYLVVGSELKDLSVIGGILWSLTRSLGPINIVLQCFQIINGSIGAFKNIYETKNNFKFYKIKNGDVIIQKINDIEISNVSFNYEDKNILENLNLKISSGEKIALLGDTGSGKSTLLDVVTNITQINKGTRKINNIEFEKINFEAFRSKISYVPQSLMMLDANIKEYFEFYKDDINDEEINKLLDYFNCSEFLGSSSDRVDYYLGDKGMRLSGGQKQKVILAAALSRNPELLILDEATSAIDYLEEKKILTKILEQNVTMIFISHNLQNKEMFDKIYRLENKQLKVLK